MVLRSIHHDSAGRVAERAATLRAALGGQRHPAQGLEGEERESGPGPTVCECDLTRWKAIITDMARVSTEPLHITAN